MNGSLSSNEPNDILEQLRRQLRDQSRDLQEIKLAIVGDTKLGMDGIAKRITKAELRVAKLEDWRNKFTLKVVTVSALAGGMTFGTSEGIKAVIQEIFKH
jgi:hypothetical protein